MSGFSYKFVGVLPSPGLDELSVQFWQIFLWIWASIFGWQFEGLTGGTAGASGNLGSRAEVFHLYFSTELDVNVGLSHPETSPSQQQSALALGSSELHVQNVMNSDPDSLKCLRHPGGSELLQQEFKAVFMLMGTLGTSQNWAPAWALC